MGFADFCISCQILGMQSFFIDPEVSDIDMKLVLKAKRNQRNITNLTLS